MNCLIVDDDPLICDLLKHYCEKINEIDEVQVAQTGFEAVNLIQGADYDLIFLDFNLPDLTGREILESIAVRSAVIMVTSQKEFALDSYNFNQIVDYIAKPVEFSRFFKAVQKVKERQTTAPKDHRIFIKDGNKLVKIDLDEVLYCKSEANYINVVFDKRNILTLMTLKDLESKLPANFQRVHRSYIVNLNKVTAIDTGSVSIESNHIPVSSTFEKTLLDKINLLN